MKESGLLVICLLCSLVWSGSGVSADNGGDDKMDASRLPTNTFPVSYDLRFTLNLNGTDSTFSGVTTIQFQANSPTDVITLNLKELNVTNVTVTEWKQQRNNVKPFQKLVYDAKNERFEIRMKSSLINSRTYKVTIAYNAKIRTDLTGLYLSSYEEGNATKWLAVTQFEPTYARRAFPCYDEPSFKTPFNISVVKRKDQTALSNMPIKKTEVGSNNNEEVVYFESTPPMSTYLAAIYVGDFVPNKNRSHITVYTHKEFITQTEYVSKDAPRYLSILENYTGIDYMLPKMDLLAIPDFNAGAMENWGLNTYREYFLLLHEESKSRMKMRASEVVQHEFTHQWFGNLVTCEWWSYTWLNEGFARYFQYFALAMVRTTWQLEELFVVETHQGALAYDQKPRHSITSSVDTLEEISDNFDMITYSKAASILRMLKHLVTESLFQKSLQSYLKEFSESIAVPMDLYSTFDNVLTDSNFTIGNNLSVNEIMSSWTLQSGYPVLDITKNDTSNIFSVTQSRFFINTTDAKNNGNLSTWLVGLTYTTEQSKNFNYTIPSAWMNETSTAIPAPKNSGWYIFNIQSSGFYRVNYDMNNWMALIKQLNESPNAIHELNRAQLIDDSFTLARAGQLNYSVPLHLSKYLKNENSTIPWYSAKNGLSYLVEHMSRSEKGYNNFKTHVSKLAGTIFKKLDDRVAKGDTNFNILSAWDAFATWACRLDNKDCTTKALEYFSKWQTGTKISADIKDAAFCIGVKNSTGSTIFNKIFTLYSTTKSISEKSSAELALGCSANRTQLREYINHILDGPAGPIKEKDYTSIVSSISATPLGLDVLYEFLSTNLNRTLKEVKDGENIVTYIYSILASKMKNDSDIEKIRNLKDNSTVPLSVRSSFAKSFEMVNCSLEWFNKYSDGIAQWALENREPDEPVTTTTVSSSTDHSVTSKPTSVATDNSTITTKPTSKPSSGAANLYSSCVVLLSTVIFTLTTIKNNVL